MRIRAGRREEAAYLSELALRSKSYWRYDADFLEACRQELTIRPEDFDRARIRVAEGEDGRVVGFYLIGEAVQGEAEVVFLFVDLPYIGKGFGRRLFEDLVEQARQVGLGTLTFDADPGAAAFYERMGAEQVGEAPSGSIPGRLLPRFRLHLR